MKNQTSFTCPNCGANLTVSTTSEATHTCKVSRTAIQRIEALQQAGVDVSHLFAMQGANGGECIASNENGNLRILQDNDPLFQQIIQQGTIPNRNLFRRWVMAQMFHMLAQTQIKRKTPITITDLIHRLGYDYQWKMIEREIYAQMKMEGKDMVNFTDRNRWFNKETVIKMCLDYKVQVYREINRLKERHCKGIPYKRVAGQNIFLSDLYSKFFMPLDRVIQKVKNSKNISELYYNLLAFNRQRIKLHNTPTQTKEWIDAYKGAGAFFTMQNMIRFHNCSAVDDYGMTLNRDASLRYLQAKAKEYHEGEGWRLIGVLKKMLADNHMDVQKEINAWSK